MKNQSPSGGNTPRERLAQFSAMAFSVVSGCIAMVWRVALLPLVFWRFSLAFGIGALRTLAQIMFALFGIALLCNLLFGMIYVLAYPWLR